MNHRVEPRRVTCVVVCVGRAMTLAHTLKRNAPLVDQNIIVTTSQDKDTQELVKACHGDLVISDRCYDDQHAFNKGRMINDGLRHIERPDWIVLTDADVFLNANLPRFMAAGGLNIDCLYGTDRFDAQPEQLESFLAGQLNLAGQQPSGINADPHGFFQLFNRGAATIRDRWPSIMCEEFCSAGGIDSWFLHQWPEAKLVRVPEVSVVHLTHGSRLGQDWNGPKRGVWRQCGVLTAQGLATMEAMPNTRPLRLRLTDLLRGQTREIEIDATGQLPPEVVGPNGQGGLRFLGQDIGAYAIHVAYFAEKAPGETQLPAGKPGT